MRLLMVEDERGLNEVMARRLKQEGFIVDALLDGNEAASYIDMIEYDAILLDISLPGIDGLALLRRIRQKGNNTPVLIITARSALADRVKGLDSGADDYLVKPFEHDELMARLRAILRRGAGSAANIIQVGEMELDINARRVIYAGEELALSSREFDILFMLVRNKNVVLSRAQIQDNIWDISADLESNIVDVYIRALRKKLGPGASLIETVRGVGYVLRG